ncbi:4Fe-4S dicluster domain-containing protein [Labilibacter sediminis]|nr:4Fe-4S dicluster domain-containing protein [Labilibacter sediminis]
MNTALYYFSGTGNSLSVAQTIKDQIKECEIFPIIGCLKQKPVEITAQRIGIIFPMHYMTVPRIVHEFLMEVRFQKPKYIFVVITGANPKLGNALSVVEQYLSKANLKLNAGYFIPMVAAHFPYLKLSKNKQPQKQYQEAKEKVLEISEKVSHLKNEFDKEFTVIGKLKQLVSKETKGKEKFFTIDSGCIRCGYCMQVCPFQNIRLHGKQIQWLDNCHSCFACLHFCSKSVIQYKKLSVGKARQHHPSVTLNDIALQRD